MPRMLKLREAAAETGYIKSADIDRLMEFRNSL